MTIDLLALDRDVKRASAKLERCRSLLAVGTEAALDEARGLDPWEGLRHTATQSTFVELAAPPPSVADVPLRDALARWVYELLQARIAHELVVADADAVHALDPRLAKRRADNARSESSDVVPHDGLDRYRDAFAELIAATDDARASTALVRAGELAKPVAAVRKERRLRRVEVARRLGLSHPAALATSASVHGVAREVLDATEPLAAALFRDARKKTEGPWRASSAIRLALGLGAPDGWPATLGARWLDDVFKALAPRGVRIARLPAARGSASFLRAASAWGYAFRASGAPRSMPFALARDPYFGLAHLFGSALAATVATPAFQRRALQLPARLADAQSRVLVRTSFLHVRVAAARALLAADESSSPSTFEEWTTRVFGAPLPASMRDAWPEPRTDEASRFLATVGTHAFVRGLVERFDEDWFRNPKAGTHLVSLACAPAHDDRPPAEGEPMALARAFEAALG